MFNSPKKRVGIQREHTERKNYKWSQSNPEISLSFSLRTDVKSELKPFLTMLKAAVEEVEADLKELG